MLDHCHLLLPTHFALRERVEYGELMGSVSNQPAEKSAIIIMIEEIAAHMIVQY